MRAGDENERLRDDCNLEVDNAVQLFIIVVNLARRRIQVGVELVLEEVRLEDHDN